jgi:hypothetical protein
MSDHISLDQMAQKIRQLYLGEPQKAEELIAAYLQQQLGAITPAEKINVLENLATYFDATVPGFGNRIQPDDEVLARLFSLVLGDRVTQADLSSSDLLQRLAGSLNTIFDALNNLVAVIGSALLGKARGEETIRQVIGFHLEGHDQTKSLESYLGQINEAFLLAQEASKYAAYQVVGSILQELDPDKIRQEAGGGLKFGALRKAELFDVFEEKMKKCRRWYETGRCSEDLQRGVENYCQSKMRG